VRVSAEISRLVTSATVAVADSLAGHAFGHAEAVGHRREQARGQEFGGDEAEHAERHREDGTPGRGAGSRRGGGRGDSGIHASFRVG